MPSDRPENRPGYLRDTLAKGAKPFHYRSGIRTLLGLPENPDIQVGYRMALPLPGFNYLRRYGLAEQVMDSPSVPGDSRSMAFETLDTPRKAQFRKSPEFAGEMEPGSALTRVAEFSTGFRAPEVSPSPALPVRKSEVQQIASSKPEELRIDIPGTSEKPLRFPALVSSKTDSTAPAATNDPRSEILQTKESPLPLPARVPPTSAVEEPVRATSRGRLGLSRDRFSPRDSVIERPVAERPSPVPEVRAEQPAVPRRLSAPPASPTSLPVTVRPTQQAAEAQIDQLRRNMGAMKRKTVPQPDAAKSAPRTEPEAIIPPSSPAPPPVVIVNPPPGRQTQSRAAFWERSYLSHFFRLRRLR